MNKTQHKRTYHTIKEHNIIKNNRVEPTKRAEHRIEFTYKITEYNKTTQQNR